MTEDCAENSPLEVGGGARRTPPQREPRSAGVVGARLRRPLTDAELEAITTAAKRRGKDGGLDGMFRATWDILLGEAEGLTMEEARRRGLRFHPAEYAIPQSQSVSLLRIWRRHRGPHYPSESAAGMLWIHMGPGSYPDDAPPAPPSRAAQ